MGAKQSPETWTRCGTRDFFRRSNTDVTASIGSRRSVPEKRWGLGLSTRPTRPEARSVMDVCSRVVSREKPEIEVENSLIHIASIHERSLNRVFSRWITQGTTAEFMKHEGVSGISFSCAGFESRGFRSLDIEVQRARASSATEIIFLKDVRDEVAMAWRG